MEDRLCQRYGCLPSQLDDEDAGRLMQVAGAGTLMDTFGQFQANPASLSESQSQAIGEALGAELEGENAG